MSDVMIKIGWTLIAKLLTETFVSKVVIHGARAWSSKTENKLDDKIVADIAEALGVKD